MSPLGIFICLPKISRRSCEPALLLLPQRGNISWEFLRSTADSLMPLHRQAVKGKQWEPWAGLIPTTVSLTPLTDYCLLWVFPTKLVRLLKCDYGLWRCWELALMSVPRSLPQQHQQLQEQGPSRQRCCHHISEITLHDAWGDPWGCPDLHSTIRNVVAVQWVKRQHKASAAARGGAIWKAHVEAEQSVDT